MSPFFTKASYESSLSSSPHAPSSSYQALLEPAAAVSSRVATVVVVDDILALICRERRAL